MKSTTLYKSKTPHLSTKDRRIVTHAWFYSIAFLLAAFAMGQRNFVIFMIMIGMFVHSFLVSIILERYPSPLQKRDLLLRIKRDVRYTREDLAYFMHTKQRGEMLLHRFWSAVFFLETGVLNALIKYRLRMKDYRRRERYHQMQMRLEKLRKAIYKQCNHWQEFDAISMQHAREEYEYYE